MKVKLGQLKTHLSKYLREIQESGERLEVCVRETPVAYLTPIKDEKDREAEPPPDIVKSLEDVGLQLTRWGTKSKRVPIPQPAGDGKTIKNSIVAMREEKDW